MRYYHSDGRGGQIGSSFPLSPRPKLANKSIGLPSATYDSKGRSHEEISDNFVQSASSSMEEIFVVEGGKCKCSKGTKSASIKFKGNSSTTFGGKKALTMKCTDMEEIDIFGICKKLSKEKGEEVRCLSHYKPVGKKWSDPATSVKSNGEEVIAVYSKLKCEIGGNITIQKNGQGGMIDDLGLTDELLSQFFDGLKAFGMGAWYRIYENNLGFLDYFTGSREPSNYYRNRFGYNAGIDFGDLLGIFQGGAELWLSGGIFLGGNFIGIVGAPGTGGASYAVVAVPANVLATALAGHGVAILASSSKNLFGGDNHKKTSSEEQIEELLSDTVENSREKGIARNFEKKNGGGLDQAMSDFDKLDLKDVKDIKTNYGNGKVGKLEDGTKVSIRGGSETGGPTIEITFSKRDVIKIRY